MKSPSTKVFSGITVRFLSILLAVGLVVVGVMVLRQRTPQPKPEPVVQTPPAAPATNLASQTPMASVTKSSAAVSGVLPDWTNFQARPLPVGYESSNVQWTLADGKDTNVIRQLAHNPLEYARMVEENPRIFKRQLVYLKETAAAVFENAKLTSEPVKQLTLPGVDGQELQFQIVGSEGDGSSRHGQFSGHLAGNNDSMVTLAFQDGREAFTILSPKENIYLVGEPREDGQVIVKAIDPNTYGMGPEETGDDSIKAQPAAK